MAPISENIIQIIVQAGSIGILLTVLYGVYKLGNRFLDSFNTITIQFQASLKEISIGMITLSEKLDGHIEDETVLLHRIDGRLDELENRSRKQ